MAADPVAQGQEVAVVQISAEPKTIQPQRQASLGLSASVKQRPGSASSVKSGGSEGSYHSA